MEQVKRMIFAVLSKILNFILARKNVVIYFCFAALYILLCGMIGFAVLVLAALQAILVLIIVKPNPAIKSLSHRMTVYIYKMLRYIVLCESEKPYPFGPLPQEIEPADDVDLRAEVPEKNMFDRDKAPEAGKAPEDRPAAGAEKEEAPSEPIHMGYSDDADAPAAEGEKK